MGVRDRFLAGLAAQLGRPDGLRGRLVARMLNRANRANVTAAVEAAGLVPGQTAADIGFGGGVGLPLLRPDGRAVVGIGDPDAMASSPVTATGFTIRPVDDVAATLVRAGLASVERRRIGEGHGAMHLLVAHRKHASWQRPPPR